MLKRSAGFLLLSCFVGLAPTISSAEFGAPYDPDVLNPAVEGTFISSIHIKPLANPEPGGAEVLGIDVVVQLGKPLETLTTLQQEKVYSSLSLLPGLWGVADPLTLSQPNFTIGSNTITVSYRPRPGGELRFPILQSAELMQTGTHTHYWRGTFASSPNDSAVGSTSSTLRDITRTIQAWANASSLYKISGANTADFWITENVVGESAPGDSSKKFDFRSNEDVP